MRQPIVENCTFIVANVPLFTEAIFANVPLFTEAIFESCESKRFTLKRRSAQQINSRSDEIKGDLLMDTTLKISLDLPWWSWRIRGKARVNGRPVWILYVSYRITRVSRVWNEACLDVQSFANELIGIGRCVSNPIIITNWRFFAAQVVAMKQIWTYALVVI